MKKNASAVIPIRVLTDAQLDNVMGMVGTLLVADGFLPLTHTRRLLTYQKELKRKGGVYVGALVPLGPVAPGVGLPVSKPGSKVATAVVNVTDLPIDFHAEDGSSEQVVAALAFGISAPPDLLRSISEVVSPYAVELDEVKANIGQLLVGKTFQKTIPDIACDHCGYVQQVTVPIRIARIEGSLGHGPGGTATVLCSNPACLKTFEVTWDNVVIQVDITE